MFENRPIEKEMKDSYLDYAMSVILSRAIPDIRDGLKPVQRRILYSMYEMGLTFDKPYRKSARIVGEVMGKYHPHGDAAIYASLARMAQPFSMRYPLVDGQGNFGSMDGDPPAAMRYTEARLEKISNELLEDIEYETVDFVPTFDGTLKEPLFLPGKLPNLLINGSSGIAVGMATNIPPHNLGEIVDALIYLIDNRGASIEELMKYIKGPDFPTGGVIMGKSGIIEAYKTGKGKIILRGKGEINKNQIIFTEIPYEVNKADLLSKMSELSKAGVIHGIQSIKDESNKEGIRIVVKLESNANPEVTLKQIYENTQMEISYGIINLVLLDQTPRVLSLKEIWRNF
jgi:Type IIA topoisomerase (DNA gyrase/topo II, topoisomerase IV), A subunit